MKLASLRNGRPDGQLVVVSHDLARYVSAGRVAPTLQAALDHWDTARPALEALSTSLDAGGIAALPFDPAAAEAPLPRAYQWIDGSGYLINLERVQGLAGEAAEGLRAGRPLLYQGASDGFVGATAPMLVPEDDLGTDFEAEIVIVVGAVPMRPSREQAAAAIRLVGLCNDVTLRRLVAEDLQSGYGFFHSKPATAFAPVFVSPEQLGSAWTGSRLALPVTVELNGRPFGRPNAGRDMHFDFVDLIEAAARTRALGAGTIIGSGTISNRHDEPMPTRRDGIGYACIVEARMVEKIRYGKARTPFLKPGDRVSIGAFDAGGRSVFGSIEQTVAVLAR
jgi:fumarylacetoacetate (FAA) hydrolase